jgi:hypothetical protein
MASNGGRTANQLAVETFMPIMVEAFHDGLREIGSIARWLLATLVVVNGAGAISLLPVEMPNELKLAGAVAFLVGILAALGAGAWALYAFKRVSLAAHTMVSYWLNIADDGPRLEALETTMKGHLDRAIGSGGTHAFVFLSVAAFVAGCVFTGLGVLGSGGMQ